jgi:hypothetical protein
MGERFCPNIEDHTWRPEGYLEWCSWADEMSKTNKQRKCPGCGRYVIWEPKATGGAHVE